MKYIASFLVLMVFAANAPTLHAYHTTDQQAFTVDGKTGVYTITFELGHGNYDVYVPVHAFSFMDAKDDHLSFEMLNEQNEKAVGNTLGIVLSSLPVKDGMYVVPKGKLASFTLLMFLSPTAGTAGAYRAQVTSLPFSFNGTQKLHLNPSELKAYTTNLLSLGSMRANVTLK